MENKKVETTAYMPEKSPTNRSPLLKLAGMLIAVVILISLYVFLLLNLHKTPQTQTNQSAAPTAQQFPTRSPDLAADWDEYRNHILGFSIRYPQDWQVVETPTATGTIVNFVPKNAKIKGEGRKATQYYAYGFKVTTDKTNNLSPQAYWEKKVKAGVKNPTFHPELLDDLPVIKTEENAIDAHDVTYYASFHNHMYTIQQNIYMTNAQEARAKFPQIDQQFKIIMDNFVFLEN